MSNTCFSCNAKIEEDSYGLTQCPDCHTFVFIDFDGHVQKPPEKEQEAGKSEVSSSAHFSQDSTDTPQPEKQDEIASDFEIPSTHQQDSTNPSQETFQVADSTDEQEFPTHSAEANSVETSSIKSGPVENNPVETNFVEPPEMSPLGSSNHSELQEVIDYANRSEPLDSGSFYYNVIISGIDSKMLRQAVMDALDDSRFGWKKEDMAALIKNGCLTIEKIDAAKTYVLMSYLKFLPLKIKWDQVSFIK